MPIQTGSTPWLMEATVYRDVVSLSPWQGKNDRNKADTNSPVFLLYCLLIQGLRGL